MLTGKRQRKTLEQLTLGFAVSGDWVLGQVDEEPERQVLSGSPSVSTYSKRDPRILQLFHRVFRDGDVSLRFWNEASLLQVVFKKYTGLSASTTSLPWSLISIPHF